MLKAVAWALALVLVVATTAVEAHHSPLAVAEEVGTSGGAQYAMFVPGPWNGRLVVYAHGFIDPAEPVALPDAAPADVAPWVIALRESLLGAGYAVAYSSYAENGWAVKDGAERTHELRGIFAARFGAPSGVYVTGRSLGGLITALLAEKHPADYRGALPICAPLGGGKMETDYIGNVRVLFDYYYPGVIPGDVLHVPPMEFTPESPIVQAILAALLAEPHKMPLMASIDQIKLPYSTPSQLILSILRPLGYNIRGTNDILARTGGESPFGNVGTTYARLGLVPDAQVNAGVGRWPAGRNAIRYFTDYYRPTGNLAIPLLTLHTTMDPDVPFSHEAAYATAVTAARKTKWLAQHSVQRYGHCNVTPHEVTIELNRVVKWAEQGVKPYSGDATLDLAIQSPASAQGWIETTLNNEITFTEAVLSALTGVTLP